ncbi:cation:proton antiporter [Paenisporosarcina cavernae]|uniref:Sodium:proton antiporter n=1 Tax=Paenisporosarcina cavernae TaxID=2320858 RepID=A0A385YSX9_9BACL|nr:sodium:proton antiporter [Paenisporosarcina cavernae]AYC28752.1 sodium:proton antiporter [Paenisporosarcina cavernae]
MLDTVMFTLMFVVVLGIASQWFAWRFQMPAIVLMSIAGLLVGPIFGWIDPSESFGEMFSPIISLAVAIILFEGSLNLDFREIRGFNKPLYRIVTFGAFIAWVAGSLAAHYVAGLSFSVAFVIGGLFIVTGPTVILPLLRQAKLKPRPAAILKWEGIIVDPFGALLALFAFEAVMFIDGEVSLHAFLLFFAAAAFAVAIGWAAGWGLGWMFENGNVPEYLKSPIVFATVILAFVVANSVMHETGLLAVTAMGIVMANMHIASIGDMRHFKENISVLLISSIFVMLTASLERETLLQIFSLPIVLFVLTMIFIVRPLSIWLSTIGTDITWREKMLIGWIAPRGIVALTVSGYFASVLQESGFPDAEILIALTFALAFSTVIVHGFTIGPFAKKLNLASSEKPGVLLIGGNIFTTELAKSIHELGHEVCIMDQSWQHLSLARQQGIPTKVGEILSEQTEYNMDLTPYPILVAATEVDSYNALVCTNFVPELGRDALYQTALQHADMKDFHQSLGGKMLFDETSTIFHLNERIIRGQVFRKTQITEQYTFTQYLRERAEEALLLYILRANEKLEFFTANKELQASPGDTVVSLTPPVKEMAKRQERIEADRLKVIEEENE